MFGDEFCPVGNSKVQEYMLRDTELRRRNGVNAEEVSVKKEDVDLM